MVQIIWNLSGTIFYLNLKTKILLGKTLTSIYFSFIQNYINYCNISWASTTRAKLDKIHTVKKQKHTARKIYKKHNLTYSKLLMSMNVLYIYQINIFQVWKFMYQAKHNLSQEYLGNTFTEFYDRYPRKFYRRHFKQPKIITKATSFVISSRESKIWNNYRHEYEKTILSLPLFLMKTNYQNN